MVMEATLTGNPNGGKIAFSNSPAGADQPRDGWAGVTAEKNGRARRMAVMAATFGLCGAKPPIIALIAGALFGGTWRVAPSARFVGIASIIISGLTLKKTSLFAGESAPFFRYAVRDCRRRHLRDDTRSQMIMKEGIFSDDDSDKRSALYRGGRDNHEAEQGQARRQMLRLFMRLLRLRDA